MNNKSVFFALVVLPILFVTGCASLEMLYPNGVEHWEKGRTYTIRWESRNIPGDVVVKLKGGTGQGGWYTACEQVPAEVGRCDYILPCNFGWRQATAHVMTLDDELSDQSDAPFSIAWPNVSELERHLRDLYAESPYFRENPRIAQATVESFDRQTLFYFCSHLANLENTGETYVPKPLALQNCSVPTPCFTIELTDNEVENIHAAKAAHAVVKKRK
jgi:hypothetical protein